MMGLKERIQDGVRRLRAALTGKNAWAGRVLLWMAAGLLLAGAAFWFFRPRGDREDDLQAARANLFHLHAAIRAFQSEKYFARAPKDLEELWTAGLMPVTVFAGGREMPVKVEPLLTDLAVFRNPASAPNPAAGFVCDYLLVPDYRQFLPENAVIVLDKPGNFLGGGHVLLNNGKILFLRMNPSEYRRFAEAVQNRADRDFVRSKCAECSIAGYKK